jgi:hypothetical protein
MLFGKAHASEIQGNNIGVVQIPHGSFERMGNPHARQRTGIQLQGVTDVVQINAVSQSRKKVRNQMTPGAERPNLLLHSGPLGQLRHQETRNEVAYLPQEIQF